MKSTESCLQFSSLIQKILEEIEGYDAPQCTVSEYRHAGRQFQNFASTQGFEEYNPEIHDKYIQHISQRCDEKQICSGYARFLLRVARIIKTLAETGEIDFSYAKGGTKKYPVSGNIIALINTILKANGVLEGSKSYADLLAPMRHLFWYADTHGYSVETIDDTLLMEFLISEIPLTNSGSTGRTLRCVKYITTHMQTHGLGRIHFHYENLTLKNDFRKMIPAFSEEEITNMAAAIDTSTKIGKRDLAIILLGYSCGLRGIDIVTMKLSDIDWRNQQVSVLQSKTNQPLILPLHGEVLNALADYVLEARPESNIPEVFLTVQAPFRKLNSQFAKMVDKYCQRAKVHKIPLRAFHSLRRSFETVLVSKGVPLDTVSDMAGHQTIAEDKPYLTFRRDAIARVAMNFLEVPITSGVYASLFNHETHK